MALPNNFFGFTPKDKKGQPYPLSQHRDKVVLVVNTASNCGFTTQLKDLEKLYKNISEEHPGCFVILAFPCNQFSNQEPGSNDDIQSFCQLNYGVTFPVLGKTNVNGPGVEPVWDWMKNEKPGLMWMTRVNWNFEKFLIGGDGKVKGRWACTTNPAGLRKVILEEVAKLKPKADKEGAKSGL